MARSCGATPRRRLVPPVPVLPEALSARFAVLFRYMMDAWLSFMFAPL
jgi:hypothetical protein